MCRFAFARWWFLVLICLFLYVLQKKSVANLRAEFFGLDSLSNGNKDSIDHLDVNCGDLEGSKVTDHHEVTSGDSDLSSDERGFEGTFSPGESRE